MSNHSNHSKNTDYFTKGLEKENDRVKIINSINIQKWYAKVKLIVKDYEIEVTALIDTGADLNCIQEGLIPSKYYQHTTETLSSANGSAMKIKYKLPKVIISQNNINFTTSFVLVNNLSDKVILGVPFIYLLYPFTVSSDKITTTSLVQNVHFEFLTKPNQHELKQLRNCSIHPTNNFFDCSTDVSE